MNRKISDTEIQYLLEHLDKLYSGVRLGQYLATEESAEPAVLSIPLSEKPFDGNIIVIDDIPVLFPSSNEKKWYSIDGKRINFHHDILKSAFYLLSGYQEYKSDLRDKRGRFPWKSSIQYELGITPKPVVNYYFEVILEAFGSFCSLNGLEFKRKSMGAPILFLSHDVDRIKKYTLRTLIYAGLQVIGLRPDPSGFKQRLKNLWTFTCGLLSSREDPYQTFAEMTALENKLNISSSWYFLERGAFKNSSYHFKDKEIRELIRFLSEKGHEIGVHGTLESSADLQYMTGSVQRLKAVSKSPVTGIRQHELKYSNPLTPNIQSSSGLIYDSTLGFAEQIGFRNSYAYPFKLYDFDNQKPMDIWQLPLIVMEVSILQYMTGEIESIPEIIRPLVSEVSRFNGVFSLLWHNCRLEEETYPGIKTVYQKVLEELMQEGYKSMTGQELIDSYTAEA
jgi:hypothetical protein